MRRVDEEPAPRQRVAWSRLAFAGALSALIVGSFASFGGLAYAVSGASSTYQVAKGLVVDHNIKVQSSARAQYPDTPTPPPPKEQVASGTAGSANTLGATATLPFTGISLLLTVIVGFTLLATGIVLRIRERRAP